MKHIIISIVLLLLIVLAPLYGNVSSEEADSSSYMLQGYNPQAEGLVISTINIDLPKRTKESFIKTMLGVKVGDIYTKTRHQSMHQELWGTNLFYDIVLTPIVEEEQVILNVSLEDKWTFFPAPFFQFSSSGVGGGIVLVEQNFLGFGELLLLSGGYSTNKYNARLLYLNKRVKGSRARLKTQLSFEGFNRIDYSHGKASNSNNPNVNNSIRKYRGLLFEGEIGSGYQFSNITLHGAVVYIDYWNDITDGLDPNFSTLNPLASSRHVPLKFSFDYDGLSPYGKMMSQGLETEVDYLFSLYSSTTNFFHGLHTTGKYSLGIGKKQIQLFSIYLEGLISNYPLILSERIGGTDTTKTLSNKSVATNKYLGTALEYLFIIWQNQSFGLTISYGLDCSIYEITEPQYIDAFSEPVFNSGVFMSIGVLFDKIAIPLAEIVVGYNFLNQYPTFGVTIGI